MYYVIESTTEKEGDDERHPGKPLLWSNEIGWVSAGSDETFFSKSDFETLNLPEGGKWRARFGNPAALLTRRPTKEKIVKKNKKSKARERNVRNFWVEAQIDGRASKFSGGPANKSGGFDMSIYQRDKGSVGSRPVRVMGGVVGDKLILEVVHDGEVVYRHETER